jgi:hypothetical protein
MTTSVDNRGERGQALALFVFALTMILGFAALTIDVGLAYVARREMQNAADAAALAGADVLLEGFDSTVAAAAARDMARQNGYDETVADVSVAVNIPPLSGAHIGDGDYVEIVIQDDMDTQLASVVGQDQLHVRARAVAGIERVPKPYSIITLNQTACRSLSFNGGLTVDISEAGTLTNSECYPDAFYAEGDVNVTTNANDVVGGWVTSGKSGNVSPDPSRAGHYDDPLVDILAPEPIDEPPRDCPAFGGGSGIVTLQPGVYDCKIDPPGGWGLKFEPGDYLITGGLIADGSGAVTFGAGMYFLQGEGLLITGNGVVEGLGVTFYIDEGRTVLTGTGDTHLTPPDSGPYADITIFQNRSLTSTVEFSGEAIADGSGAVYAAGAKIHIVGNATSTFHQFISDTFAVEGNSILTIDWDGGFMVPAPKGRLVE